MSISTFTTDDAFARYDAWIRSQATGSFWQSLERKRYLETCGKVARIYVLEEGQGIEASALVSIDRTIGGLSTWEIPRGPVWNNEEAARNLLRKIIMDARSERCMALFISPGAPLDCKTDGFQSSGRYVHAEATRIIAIDKDEDAILAQMHTKGRYNIGIAQKRGVTVSRGSTKDIGDFYDLLKRTGGRDGFKISQISHYTRFLESLEDSFILMARHNSKPIAGLIGVIWNGTGIYYYGASSYEDRSLMAPYLLQWEALRFCRAAGCTSYDLLGISPETGGIDDPWRGITDFKRKFGGTVVTYPPERSIVLRPFANIFLHWKRSILG